MAATLLDSFKNLLTPQNISAVAGRLGEPETGASRGLVAGAGALLLGLLNKASDTNGIKDVHNLVTGAAPELAAAGNVGDILGSGASPALGGLGSRLISLIFGGSGAGVADVIARSAGLKPGSGTSILATVAPVILSLIAGRIKAGGLSPSGLGSMLMNEADSIKAAAPAGLGVLLGGMGGSIAGDVSRAASAVATPAKKGGWGWAAIAAAIILGLLWFATRGKTPPETSVAADTAAAAPATDVQAYSPSAAQTVTLPNGTTLNVPGTSLESQIVAFITDSTRPVDKTTWFNFDRLLFETGSATLRPESQAQLRNVATIFAAFPTVKAKIGGYTDNTGNAATNMKLSQDRATSVMNELVGMGVDKSRLAAEGYGDQHPVADNGTEEGRAQNRRIAMRIVEK